MTNEKLVHMLAEAAYDKICDRAMKMAEEVLPPLSTTERLRVEAAIAAGVTATIQTFNETGLIKDGSG